MYKTLQEYPLKYIARIIIQTETPLNLSSGEKDSLTDSLIMTDANGLPMIPGTSLTGVLRSNMAMTNNIKTDTTTNENDISNLFGWQKPNAKENEQSGAGSRIIISNAHFVGKDGVIEGLKNIDWNDEFYSMYNELPVRDHTKINDKGTTEKGGKFDEQVIYKGTRFCFEIELTGNEDDEAKWNQLLKLLQSKTLRIGGGTRKGFGAIKIIDLNTIVLDLEKKEDLNIYIEKSSSLKGILPDSKKFGEDMEQENLTKYTEYKLLLFPENLWVFGSGFGDDEVDMTPVYENVVEWNNNIPEIKENRILIPATSVKGAISHRTAFHYNKIRGDFIDDLESKNKKPGEVTGENNNAVRKLFGLAKDSSSEDKEKKEGARGRVIFSDLFITNENSEKILNHVAIDRFTGGAIDGALFDEKVITQSNEIDMYIYVKNDIEDKQIIQAFTNTLKDICNGMLPLGGSTMRGHGCFQGKLFMNGKEINNA